MSIATTFDINLITIEDIVIVKASIENNTEITRLQKNMYSLNVSHAFAIGVAYENSRMKATYTCNVKASEKASDKEVDINANFSIAFIFMIENLADLVTTEPKMNINEDLVYALCSIAYATSRGIVFSRCQGTIMRPLMLPILSDYKIKELFAQYTTA